MKIIFSCDELTIPAKYEVCSRCNGKGTHVNSSIDGNGLSSDDMHKMGPDFLEDYLSGVYDVPCYECNGEKVVMVPNESKASPEELKAYYDYLQNEADYQAEIEAERKMGA